MSLRHLRKVQEAKARQNPVLNSDSDDDFEPSYVQRSSKSTYEGLYLSSSSSEEENKVKEESTTDTEKEDPKPGCSQKPQMKKKKKQKKKNSRAAGGDDIDEIDRSVSEVNAMLGEPSIEKEITNEWPEDKDKTRLFSINYRHLNPSNDIFGPESDDEQRKKKGRRPHFKRIHRCRIIQKNKTFKKLGLSMSIVQQDKGLTYFAYDHDKDYQKLHREIFSFTGLRNIDHLALIDSSLDRMHIEGLIEAADILFHLDESPAANEIIEEAIAYMEYMAHPSFNMVDLNIRLEYKYFENRAFHILILKYIHLLSNRACHRTALELAKLLMNLDPSDPLGVVLIIDTLAIRAREYKWLVEAIDHLDKEREAGYMFNMKFSKALANFFIFTKEKRDDMTPCDEMLQHALLAYPWALREILDVADRKNEAVRSCTLFDDYARETTSEFLQRLIHLYVAFTSSQWRNTRVLQWFIRNANEVARANEITDTYDEELLRMHEMHALEGIRRYMFRTYPEQIRRHLSVIQPMNNLLVEGAVPEVSSTRSFDPMPPRDGINRHGYSNQPRLIHISRGSALLAEFFASLLPNYDLLHEREEREE